MYSERKFRLNPYLHNDEFQRPWEKEELNKTTFENTVGKGENAGN